MNNPTVELLDRLAAWHGGEHPSSDYRLAKDYFHVSSQSVSTWRAGHRQFGPDYVARLCGDMWPDDDAAVQYWLCRIAAYGEHNVRVKQVWDRLAKQVAAYTIAGVMVAAPVPDARASVSADNGRNIYYAHFYIEEAM